MRKLILSILSVLFFSFSLFSQTKPVAISEEEKIINAMLMNNLLYSLETIYHYDNRVVLEHEYNNIFDKIDKKRLKDPDAYKAYDEALKTILRLRLKENEKVFLLQQAEKEKKEAVYKTLQGTALSSIYGIQQIGSGIRNAIKIPKSIGQIIQGSSSLLYSGVSAFFNYRNAVNSVQNQLNKDLFKISQQEMKFIETDLINLWGAYTKIFNRYDIPKRYEIKRDQIKWLVAELDPQKKVDNQARIRLLESKKDIFKYFTPYWYELGVAYQNEGNFDLAKDCYSEFERQKINYSIIDNDSYYTELAKNMIDMLSKKDIQKIDYYLNIIEKDETEANESENKLYLASMNYSLNRKEKALEDLRWIIDNNKKYVVSARDLYEFINSENDKNAGYVFLLNSLQICTPEEIITVLANTKKNDFNSSYLDKSNMVVSIPEHIGKNFSTDLLINNTYYDSERVDFNGYSYYFVNYKMQKIVKENQNIILILQNDEGYEYMLNFEVSYFAKADLKKIDNAFEIIAKKSDKMYLDYSDLAHTNVSLFLKLIEDTQKSKEYKEYKDSNATEKMADALAKCFKQSETAFLREPYKYRNNILKLDNTLVTYGLKTIKTRNELFSFSKYGDMIKNAQAGSSKSNENLNNDLSKALKGNPKDQLNYALHFYNGDICEKNYIEAVKWFKLAANGNESDAFYYLGICFEKGLGVSKNINRAQYYYNEAYKRGNLLAEKLLGDKARNFAFISSKATIVFNDKEETLEEKIVPVPTNTECFLIIQYEFSAEQKENKEKIIPAKIVVSTENRDLIFKNCGYDGTTPLKPGFENSDIVFNFNIETTSSLKGKVRFRVFSTEKTNIKVKIIYLDTEKTSIGPPQEVYWNLAVE